MHPVGHFDVVVKHKLLIFFLDSFAVGRLERIIALVIVIYFHIGVLGIVGFVSGVGNPLRFFFLFFLGQSKMGFFVEFIFFDSPLDL